MCEPFSAPLSFVSTMAVDGERSYGDRKRKRGSTKRKLLVNERVEVKSFEEGLLGSWHPGKVIRCGRQKRHIKYDNVLDDDGVNYVVEAARVPNVLDGVSSPISWRERGLIRPKPSVIEFGERDLSFGLCVDVNYQDAWWEGVIFDHCDQMNERSVFFPDLGDEMKVGIQQLRITQDWDEVTEDWKTRGKWVFLELFEECEKISYVGASAKQIWYDVREREDFESIRDWSCNVKDLWRVLVVEVVGDYYTLTLQEIFPSINLHEDFLRGTPKLELSQPIDNNHNDSSHSDLSCSDCGINKHTRKTKAKFQRVLLPMRVLRISKKVQQLSAPSMEPKNPQNVMSWLIDNDMVLPRNKVFYWANGDRNTPEFVGRITRDGIKCRCCHKLYGPAGFVNHAGGGDNHMPSASIFLKDGRSLFDCMVQVMRDRRTREINETPGNNLLEGENDNVCTICNDGGEVLLCDKCPSVFHKKCLNMEDIPDGDWFCPSCRCGVCGQIKFEGTKHGDLITCVQCEHKYHVGCLKSRPDDQSTKYLEHWFCGKECEQVYAGLHDILGKIVTVGEKNLTWTLIKWEDPENGEIGSAENDLLAETYSKLSVALSVMHECFEPLKNPFSNRDLVEDVLFNKRSKLNRLNFQGFYTILLERNEEMISVATLRVFGEKVAELPLVGTRGRYRRSGMCGILLDELEKKLTELGVERLVLPAVPSVLDSWKNTFGFSEMTDFERAQFLDCAFLDFQGTIMCRKLLNKVHSPDSALTRETDPKEQQDGFSFKCRFEFDKSSSASEVDQIEEIEKSGMVDLMEKETEKVNI